MPNERKEVPKIRMSAGRTRLMLNNVARNVLNQYGCFLAIGKDSDGTVFFQPVPMPHGTLQAAKMTIPKPGNGSTRIHAEMLRGMYKDGSLLTCVWNEEKSRLEVVSDK